MEQLERFWDGTTHFFSGLVSGFEKAVTGVFGSSNARYVKKLQTRVDAINALEDTYAALSDEGLREVTEQFKNCLLYTSPSPRDKRQSRMPSSA